MNRRDFNRTGLAALGSILIPTWRFRLDQHYIATPDRLFIIAVPGDFTLSMALRTMFEAVAGPEPTWFGTYIRTGTVQQIEWCAFFSGQRHQHTIACDGFEFRISNLLISDNSASGALSLLFDHYAKARRPQEAAG